MNGDFHVGAHNNFNIIHRFVLAATDHLHKRISKMTERIRQLEDALAIMQGSVSDEPHPLLRDELLSLKVDKGEEKKDDSNETPRGIDGLGTLSINDRGNAHFFGSSGGSEVSVSTTNIPKDLLDLRFVKLLLLNDDDDDTYSLSPNAFSPSPLSAQSSIRDSKSPIISPEIALFSNTFPFTPISSSHDILQKIEAYLPPWEDAIKLAEIYLEQAAWLFRSLTRSQLMDEMLPAIYRRPSDSADRKLADLTDFNVVRLQESRGPHSLSLLFMTFAVGTLVDLNMEPFSAEADRYYHLARAALTLQSVFEQPNLFTIQVLHLMSIYNGMRQPNVNSKEDNNETTSMEMSWSLIRLCHQLAQTVRNSDTARICSC